jgi:hypothetical protein
VDDDDTVSGMVDKWACPITGSVLERDNVGTDLVSMRGLSTLITSSVNVDSEAIEDVVGSE